MKTRLRRALAMIALIAFIVTMLPLSAFAEARTSFIRSRIDSRPARPDSGIEIVPHKTETRSAVPFGTAVSLRALPEAAALKTIRILSQMALSLPILLSR